VSSEAVRDRIRMLIEGEAAGAVLSDDRITEILRGEGVDIAAARWRNTASHAHRLLAQRRRVKRDGPEAHFLA